MEKSFPSRQKYKAEAIEVMQLLVKLLMNSLYGENIRKDKKTMRKNSLVNQKLG